MESKPHLSSSGKPTTELQLSTLEKSQKKMKCKPQPSSSGNPITEIKQSTKMINKSREKTHDKIVEVPDIAVVKPLNTSAESSTRIPKNTISSSINSPEKPLAGYGKNASIISNQMIESYSISPAYIKAFPKSTNQHLQSSISDEIKPVTSDGKMVRISVATKKKMNNQIMRKFYIDPSLQTTIYENTKPATSPPKIDLTTLNGTPSSPKGQKTKLETQNTTNLIPRVKETPNKKTASTTNDANKYFVAIQKIQNSSSILKAIASIKVLPESARQKLREASENLHDASTEIINLVVGLTELLKHTMNGSTNEQVVNFDAVNPDASIRTLKSQPSHPLKSPSSDEEDFLGFNTAECTKTSPLKVSPFTSQNKETDKITSCIIKHRLMQLNNECNKLPATKTISVLKPLKDKIQDTPKATTSGISKTKLSEKAASVKKPAMQTTGKEISSVAPKRANLKKVTSKNLATALGIKPNMPIILKRVVKTSLANSTNNNSPGNAIEVPKTTAGDTITMSNKTNETSNSVDTVTESSIVSHQQLANKLGIKPNVPIVLKRIVKTSGSKPTNPAIPKQIAMLSAVKLVEARTPNGEQIFKPFISKNLVKNPLNTIANKKLNTKEPVEAPIIGIKKRPYKRKQSKLETQWTLDEMPPVKRPKITYSKEETSKRSSDLPAANETTQQSMEVSLKLIEEENNKNAERSKKELLKIMPTIVKSTEVSTSKINEITTSSTEAKTTESPIPTVKSSTKMYRKVKRTRVRKLSTVKNRRRVSPPLKSNVIKTRKTAKRTALNERLLHIIIDYFALETNMKLILESGLYNSLVAKTSSEQPLETYSEYTKKSNPKRAKQLPNFALMNEYVKSILDSTEFQESLKNGTTTKATDNSSTDVVEISLKSPTNAPRKSEPPSPNESGIFSGEVENFSGEVDTRVLPIDEMEIYPIDDYDDYEVPLNLSTKGHGGYFGEVEETVSALPVNTYQNYFN